MRTFSLGLITALLVLSVAAAQTNLDKTLEAQLKKVFPMHGVFGEANQTSSPLTLHIPAMRMRKPVAGYVFWTTELEPLERAYDGPIKILVGVDTSAHLTGVLVTEHHEPYGYFSVEPPEFGGAYSEAKASTDPFKVGSDVAAVSRASILDQ